MRKTLLGCLLLVLCTVVGACGSDVPASPPSSGAPTSSEPASPAPRSPLPTPRTKAQDAADLKKALVTPRDLGTPWVQPKSVATSRGKKGEICPGHVSATTKLPARPAVAANFTEGKGTGKNIATFELSTATDGESAGLRGAYVVDQKACAKYRDADGLYIVRSLEGPSSVTGSDEVLGAWAERIYYDKAHKKLAYARHYLVLRTGDVVTYVSYAFLAVDEDARAEDFARATKLAARQLTKNATVFP